MLSYLLLAFAQIDPVTAAPVVLEQIRKADQTGIIYLFVLVIALGGIGFFVLLRYVLTHAGAIHSESNKTLREIQADNNKTLLEIMGKHESRLTTITEAFSRECAELREVILKIMSDARDMVHATRNIATEAVSAKDLVDKYEKEEERLKARRDREGPPRP